MTQRKTFHAIMWEGNPVVHKDGDGSPAAYAKEFYAANAFSWYPKDQGYSKRLCVMVPVEEFIALGGSMELDKKDVDAARFLREQIQRWDERVRRLEESGCTSSSTEVNLDTARYMMQWLNEQLFELGRRHES